MHVHASKAAVLTLTELATRFCKNPTKARIFRDMKYRWSRLPCGHSKASRVCKIRRVGNKQVADSESRAKVDRGRSKNDLRSP